MLWAVTVANFWALSGRISRQDQLDVQISQKSSCLDLSKVAANSSRLLSQQATARYAHIDDHAIIGCDEKAVAASAVLVRTSLETAGFKIGKDSPPGK